MRRSPFATSLRALLLSIALLASTGACGSSYSRPDATQSKTAAPAATPASAPDSEDTGKDKDAAKWGNWRWKGNRDQCYYVAGNECFEDKQAACKAAGCDGQSCTVDNGAPAKVSCE